jgi:hypothetical protein
MRRKKMNENVIIVALVIMTLLFCIVLWKIVLLEKYVDVLEYRIKSLEVDDSIKRAFKRVDQRFDLKGSDSI